MPGARARYLEIGDGDRIPEGLEGIRVGSESCTRLLPSAGNIRSLSETRDPGSLSLVTPVAGPDEVDAVLEAIRAAVTLGWGEVVINDWGVLDQVGGGKGSDITAGRLLMRFRRGPGVFDPWEDLDPATRRYFAWGPLYDSPFLAFLREKGVGRIELDPPRHWLQVPETDGFRFSIHRDTRLISISAACPWLYDEDRGAWKPAEKCGRPCGERDDIVMTSSALEGPLVLRGKAILERVNFDVTGFELPVKVDRVIYDRMT